MNNWNMFPLPTDRILSRLSSRTAWRVGELYTQARGLVLISSERAYIYIYLFLTTGLVVFGVEGGWRRLFDVIRRAGWENEGWVI